MVAAVLALWGTAVACNPLPGGTITVTTTVDAHDADPGDGICEATVGIGDCTLRAAVEEASAVGGADLAVPTGYPITLAGTSGPETLDITSQISVNWDAPVDGVAIGAVDPFDLDPPLIDVHAGALFAVDGVALTKTRTAGLLAMNRSRLFAWPSALRSTLIVTSTGNAAIMSSEVQSVGYDAAITNAGVLNLRYSTVLTLNTIGAIVSTTGAGTTTMDATRLLSMFVYRGTYSQGGNPSCAGNPVRSKGYNYTLDTTCTLRGAGDIEGAPYNAAPGTATEPSATSPVTDAIPVGTDGCGTQLLIDIGGHPRPSDGNGDGVLACDIGAAELQLTAPPWRGARTHRGAAPRRIALTRPRRGFTLEGAR